MKIAAQTVLFVVLSVIFAAVMLAVSPVAFGQESPTEVQAPFGLEWGAKKESFSGMHNCEPNGQFVICRTKFVPKTLSDADYYMLGFHVAEGLQKVSYVGENIINDYFGRKGKERFEHLKSALLRKYPKAKQDELVWINRRLYEDLDEFYECLLYGPRCGVHVLLLDPGKGSILMKIHGVSGGKGFVDLTYESPKWDRLIDSKEEAEKAQDEDAL